MKRTIKLIQDIVNQLKQELLLLINNNKSTFNYIRQDIPVMLNGSRWAVRDNLIGSSERLFTLTTNIGEHNTLTNELNGGSVYMFPFGRSVKIKNINNRNTIVDFELSIWKTDTISGGNPIEIYYKFDSSQPSTQSILINNNIVIKATDFLHFFVRSKASIVNTNQLTFSDVNILFENV